MRKSKAAKKKQKRKVKKKQVKALRFKKATRENGWFYLENADYFFDIGNMDRAVKFVKKAARALPNEEEVFRVMGYIASGTGNTDLELDAMAALERIGKLSPLCQGCCKTASIVPNWWSSAFAKGFVSMRGMT